MAASHFHTPRTIAAECFFERREPMYKIVFFCIPAHGHTNPTLAVVKELVSRGHQVWYYSYDLFREKIQAAGATYVSCDAFDAELRLSPDEAARIGKDIALSTRVLTDTALALDSTVCAHMKQLQPDCIVADSMAVWGKAVAMKLKIPFVSSTTTFAFNRYSAKIMKQSAADLVKMLFAMPRIQKDIRRLQQAGYPVTFSTFCRTTTTPTPWCTPHRSFSPVQIPFPTSMPLSGLPCVLRFPMWKRPAVRWCTYPWVR